MDKSTAPLSNTPTMDRHLTLLSNKDSKHHQREGGWGDLKKQTKKNTSMWLAGLRGTVAMVIASVAISSV